MALDSGFRQDLLDFAEMSASAYGHNIPRSSLFGFHSTGGLGARVYSYRGKIVVAFKGATPSILGYPLGPSAANDQELVNLLFSCCWSEECVRSRREGLARHGYFRDAALVVRQAVRLFPERQLVLTGHSLGGVIASVLAAEGGLSAIVFSTLGDRHLLSSLGLSGEEGSVIHVGSCSDSIYTGRCSGKFSICSLLNYHYSTNCHSGRTYCIESEMAQGILSHKIEILKELLRKAETMRDLQSLGCHDCLPFSEPHASRF
jgi:lipase ATG15